MNINDYLIDQSGLDWDDILSEWRWLLPESFTVWLVNRIGDMVLIFDDGSVHFFDIGAGTLKKIATNREDFSNRLIWRTTQITGS